MRVGFDARWYNDSGVGTYVVQLLKALVPLQARGVAEQNGFELVVYENPRNPVPGLPQNSVERIGIAAGKYSLGGQFALKRQAIQDRLDVFHSPFYPIPLGISCPVVVTIHDLIPFLFPSDSWPKRVLIKRGYRLAAARSSRIITVSNHTAQDVNRILHASAEKIIAIHNGVSHSDFRPNASATEASDLASQYGIRSPYVVVGSARNWRTKNLGRALQALTQARHKSGVDFQTVVYGPPDGLRAAGGADAWKRLNLIQTGLLPATQLARLFRHAHLFMMPSFYEGFGLTVIEAMACGCPGITSKAGSLPEVAGEGAQLFDPFDVIGMAAAAARLLSDPVDLTKWKERALRRAADFSWERAAQETLSVYYQPIGKF